MVRCKETNKDVILVHQGFDIAIIKRSEDSKQECVNINTLDIEKRVRPLKVKLTRP